MDDTSLPANATLDVLLQVLDEKGRITVKPDGLSMGSRFARADGITIVPMPTTPVSVGTILVFPRRSVWIAHRVLRRVATGTETKYVTGGDGSALPDADAVSHGGSVGVVVQIQDAGRVVDLTGAAARFRAWGTAMRSIAAAVLKHPCRAMPLLRR